MITKIITQNIGNIKSKDVQASLEELFKLKSDIYCLQNLKTNDLRLINKIVNKYESLNNEYKILLNCNKNINNYGGVAIILKNDICNKYYISSDIPNFAGESIPDEFAGRIISIEFKDYVLCNILGYQKDNQLYRELFYNLLNIYLGILQNKISKPIIVCGDLNGCSTDYDTQSQLINLVNTSNIYKEYKTESINNLIKTCNLIDIVRTNYGKTRIFTFMNKKNIECRTDYFLSSANHNNITYLCVKPYNEIIINNHYPLELTIEHS